MGHRRRTRRTPKDDAAVDKSENLSASQIIGYLAIGIIASTAVARDALALLSPLAGNLEHIAVSSFHQARKAVVLILGSSILVIGLAMIVLPGPALVVIPIGLAVLALEFAWARRWLSKIRQQITGTTKGD